MKHRSVPEFSSYLPYAGMIDEGVIITKDAILMRTFRLHCFDLSYEHNGKIITSLKTLNNSFRLLSDGWTIYIDAIRSTRTIGDSVIWHDAPEAVKRFDGLRGKSLGRMFSNAFYLTYCYSIEERKTAASFLFRNEGTEHSIGEDVRRFITITDELYNILLTSFQAVEKLTSSSLLTYLHSCFSSNHRVLMPECPFYLDLYLSDIRFYPDSICRLNGEYMLCASIRDFPSETHTGMLHRLMKKNIAFRLTSRFVFLSRETAKKKITSIRKTHFQKRKGIGALLSEAILKSPTSLEDTESISLTAEAGEALSTMASGDIAFGYLSTSIMVKNASYKKAKSELEELVKSVNEAGFICKEETYNSPFTFLGSLPGNIHENVRQPLISSKNMLHLFPVSDTWEGNFSNEHIKTLTSFDYPLMVTKSNNSAFYLNLNVGDVGHTLVIGPTGSGKSIILNTFALQFLRYPGVRVVFFDKDASSRYACRNAGGIFYTIGAPDEDLHLNPFCGIDGKEHRLWLKDFLAQFFRSRTIPLSSSDETEILRALESMSRMNIEHLCFDTFQKTIQDEEMRAAVTCFTANGEYSHLFGPVTDTFSSNRFISFEMNVLMRQSAEIVQFVLGYLFYKLKNLFDGSPTLLILDEAWLFLDNDFFASYVKDWLKTLRKKNVYVILATQEVSDTKTTIFSTILNACKTKIVLPNPQANQSENMRLYQELGLSEGDIDAVAGATEKKEYFYLSPRGKQMFDLCLCETQLSMLTSFMKGDIN